MLRVREVTNVFRVRRPVLVGTKLEIEEFDLTATSELLESGLVSTKFDDGGCLREVSGDRVFCHQPARNPLMNSKLVDMTKPQWVKYMETLTRGRSDKKDQAKWATFLRLPKRERVRLISLYETLYDQYCDDRWELHHLNREHLTNSNADCMVPNEDFSAASWRGREFTFTEAQAIVIRTLYDASNHATKWVSQRRIFERISDEGITVDTVRLRDVFKSNGKMHPAWGTLIVPERTPNRNNLFGLARA